MNSSRNQKIDTEIKPGPYNEVLPCKELCYGLVQSCPAALQFSCPLPRYGLNNSYGDWYTDGVGPGQVTCNNPAADMSNSARALRSYGVHACVAISTALLIMIT